MIQKPKQYPITFMKPAAQPIMAKSLVFWRNTPRRVLYCGSPLRRRSEAPNILSEVKLILHGT
jgi:hypothetical protein